MQSLGEKIRQARREKGLTQEQAARLLGVSQVQVSRLERRGLANLRKLLDD